MRTREQIWRPKHIIDSAIYEYKTGRPVKLIIARWGISREALDDWINKWWFHNRKRDSR